MKKNLIMVVGIVLVIIASSLSHAENNWGNALKAATTAAIKELTPQAQAAIDQTTALPTAAAKEKSLIAKAKSFMSSKNYQTALEISNYILTYINPKSAESKKLVEEAKAAISKLAQDKINKVQSSNPDANKAISDLKTIFGSK